MTKARRRLSAYALAGGSVAILIASCLIGPAGLSISEALAGLFADNAAGIIVRDIRLPRALAAWAAGAALGASGAAMQGLLRNPLADPGVLGVSAMAALGAVIAIYFNLSAHAYWATPVAAILFAALATAFLYISGAGRLSPTRLILVGVGLSSFSGALIALAMNLAPNPFILSDLVNWLFGAVANRSFDDLALAAPFIAAGFCAALFAAPGLTALSLGEETAASLGADIARTRALAISGAALMTGASVALAGAIGFVGIVAPHLARPFVSHDPGRAILPSALIGGAILSLADLVIRLLPFDQELKLGVAAALIGAPGFIWIAARTERIAR
ncbi:MAG: ABC transporter permease [Alphaproteobacteria bacterium RIFCSPHIGHO2_12_FULL_63_12]|nr:MAG: ABC transporter permease [Alphaproteobacteria bacterium RIFCSPHIGHO2_12_FULL_63_12]